MEHQTFSTRIAWYQFIRMYIIMLIQIVYKNHRKVISWVILASFEFKTVITIPHETRMLIYMYITYSSPKGGCTNPLSRPGAQNRYSSSCEKKFRTYHLLSFQSWEVGGGGLVRSFLNLKIFDVICTHKFVCQEWHFLTYFANIPWKSHVFTMKQFLPIFYTQNGHFSIFVGALTLWRHSDVIING